MTALSPPSEPDVLDDIDNTQPTPQELKAKAALDAVPRADFIHAPPTKGIVVPIVPTWLYIAIFWAMADDGEDVCSYTWSDDVAPVLALAPLGHSCYLGALVCTPGRPAPVWIQPQGGGGGLIRKIEAIRHWSLCASYPLSVITAGKRPVRGPAGYLCSDAGVTPETLHRISYEPDQSDSVWGEI